MMSSQQDYIDEKNKLQKQRDEFQEIIVALCDRDSRCTKCYRYMSVTDRSNCGGCEEYYCECNCKALTPDQILNGEFT